MYLSWILEGEGVRTEDTRSTLVSWVSQVWSLISCGLDKRSWWISFIQEEGISTICNEGYMRVDLQSSFEWSKWRNILLKYSGKDKKILIKKIIYSWRTLKLKYLISPHCPFIFLLTGLILQWSHWIWLKHEWSHQVKCTQPSFVWLLFTFHN